MTPIDDARLIGMLNRVLRDCGNLYRKCGTWMVRRHPTAIESSPDQFIELMEDLHRGLLIKVYVITVRADDRWTGPEKLVAAAMIEYLWGEKLRGSELREAATGLFMHADALTWESLVAPFVRYEALADSKAQVETIVMRLANLVAKCDGQTLPEETATLHSLQREIDMALHPANPAEVLAPLSESAPSGPHAQAQQKQRATDSESETTQVIDQAQRDERLRKALAELDGLVGLQAVKDQVRSYTNFLKLQQTRREKGLSTMPISLHMIFVGNPGTGKTTVARIVGQILGAMGTLQTGHVVETDRSGLVAEYAGQTGPKTNKLCDSALGGVLFIDEAYSLIDESGDDAYGREAIQTLLKRMEDDRDRIAVILAGYSDEMRNMIRSNPGLSSRINTNILFEDYQPSDLGYIFELMCDANQYQISSGARHRLLIGFDHLFQKRDRHFGNGRLVRNTFEDTVRKLADRIADVATLTESLLTQFTPDDIRIPGISEPKLQELLDAAHELKTICGGCDRNIKIEPTSLGQKVKCNKCEHVQVYDWAEIRHEK